MTKFIPSWKIKSMLIIMLLLCGCSKEQEKTDLMHEKGYVAEYSEKNVSGEIREFRFYRDMPYFMMDENGVTQICSLGETGAELETVLTIEKEQKLIDFGFLSDGRIVVAVLLPQKEEYALALKLYDGNGNAAKEISIPELEGAPSFCRIKITGDDFIALSLDRSACLIGVDGSIKWMFEGLDFQVSNIHPLMNGEIILEEAAEREVILHKITASGQMRKDFAEIPNYMQIVDSSEDLFAVGTGSLYEIDENGNRAEVLSLAAQGINPADLQAVDKSEKLFTLCLWKMDESTVFQMVKLEQKEDVTRKKILNVSVITPDMMRGTIANFNMRNKTYRAELSALSDDFETSRIQIDASLLTANAPDLLANYGYEKYVDYVQKGALRDVTDLIPKEKYMEKVIRDFSINGRIYGFPSYYTIVMMYTSSEALHGVTTWGVKEFLDFMEENPNALMEPDSSPEKMKKQILTQLLRRGIYEFVDFEKKQAYLDTNDFLTVLERIQGLQITPVSETRDERNARGETVLWVDYLRKPEDVQIAAARIGLDKTLSLIGFPDGKNGSGGYIGYSDVLAINNKTSEVEAAEDFFSIWLEQGNKKAKYQLPIGKDGLEEMIETAKEKKYKKDEEGNLILDQAGNPIEEALMYWNDTPIYALTEDQEQMFRDAIESSVHHTRGEDVIIQIIQEEASAYFAENISIEMTINKIQNRVQLYFDEMD